MMNAKEKAYKSIMCWKPRDTDNFTFEEIDKALDIAIQEAKKEVFDDIDNHIGLWVAKDKDSKPTLVEPEWYKEIKNRHLSAFQKKSNIIADKPKSAKIYIGGV